MTVRTSEMRAETPRLRSGGRRSDLRWPLMAALFGLAERMALWLVYAPASFGDTPSYLRLAEALRRAGLSGYDGTRVPGYPTFLNLLGRDPQSIWAAQMALGWTTSLMLLYLGWRIAASPRVGAVAATLYNLSASMLLFEASLLSEALTTFLVTLAFTLLLALDGTVAGQPPGASADAWVGWLLAAALGGVVALAGLTRPLFYLLPPALAVFVWFAGVLRRPLLAARSTAARPAPSIGASSARMAGGLAARIGRLVAFGLPAAGLLGGWLLWVYRSYEMLSPTTMGGYHLVQHTGEYFEYLPDEHARLRDTYLKYREAQVAARGTQTNAIWDAIPEMTEVTGLSFFGLSAELQRVSLLLIREHPSLYLENVVEGWIGFWKAPVYWDPDLLRSEWLKPVVSTWAAAGRGMALAANAAFLMISVGAVLWRGTREKLRLDLFSLALGGTVWLASIVQTLADHGDNPRFLIPLQPVVMLFVLRQVWAWRVQGAEP